MKTGYKSSKYFTPPKSFGNNSKSKLSPSDLRYEFWTKVFNLLTSGLTIVVVVVFATFVFYSKDLPDPTRLSAKGNESGTKIVDRNDKPIFELYGDKNRVLIKLEDVSPNVLHATLSAEDAEFFIHSGFSVRGMARAVKIH